MSLIQNISAREILDSRGNPTIEVTLQTNNIFGMAAVPSGASTGKHEAKELRDHGKRYFGQGVQTAIKNVRKIILPLLQGIDCTRQNEVDQLMIKLDNTDNKSKLGANAILGVSLANARAAAQAKNLYLYEYINTLLNKKQKMAVPRAFFNIINGGKHAGNDLAIQEFMITPKFKSFKENLRAASEIYHTLKDDLKQRYGKAATNVGDEGGFAPPLDRCEEAFQLITTAIIKAGYKNRCDIAIDAAASEFYSKGKYFIDGNQFTKTQLLDYYLRLIKKYKIISIEDPFEQEDFQSFAELRCQSKIQIVGDDLTVTNVQRIKEAIKHKSCNCLLLKVNQIGTLTEALEAVKLAYDNQWKVMVSHRSGETEDTFIADLAVGIGCGQIKAGAPCRGERTAKYNQLLRIEELLKSVE